jgi:hypothetical protein
MAGARITPLISIMLILRHALATEGQLYPAYLNHCQSANRLINGVSELISLK